MFFFPRSGGRIYVLLAADESAETGHQRRALAGTTTGHPIATSGSRVGLLSLCRAVQSPILPRLHRRPKRYRARHCIRQGNHWSYGRPASSRSFVCLGRRAGYFAFETESDATSTIYLCTTMWSQCWLSDVGWRQADGIIRPPIGAKVKLSESCRPFGAADCEPI